jgi:hypothetical protein
MTYDPDHPGEMTDAELDRILLTGNQELLNHIQAATDPGGLLTELMGRSVPGPGARTGPDAPDRSTAREMIRMRVLANAIVRDLGQVSISDLGQVRDLVRRYVSQVRDLVRGPVLDLDQVRDQVRDRVRDLSLGLDRAVGPEGAVVLDRLPALVRDFDQILGLSRVRDFDLVRDLDLALVLDRVRALIRDLDQILDPGQVFDLSRVRDLSRICDQAIALAANLDHVHLYRGAQRMAKRLWAEQVDASDTDLSDMEIEDLDVLDGVIWTRATTWPSSIGAQVKENSEEIRNGVYKVRLGQKNKAWMS